ncbi:MAG: sugar ABC transporter ATP-binding protein [Christensenellales bacterium]
MKVTEVSKAFGGVQALSKVNLTIKKGEIHCLAGGNGSGKSTLIKIISGFYKADSGTIQINGKDYQKLSTMESIEQGVQVIYQDFSVFPNLTVAENIALNDAVASKKKLVNWKKVYQKAEEALKKINIVLPLHEKVEELSVSDKQLIAIARAMLHKANLLIMDEPTTALTRKEIHKLFTAIRHLQKQGVAVLFVSHKLDEVFEIADNFTILRNGQNVITDSTKNVDHKKFIYYMTGRSFDAELFQPEVSREQKPLFQVKGLGLENGFSDISFSVYPGEVIGIIGLLGSGRTELAMALFGLYAAEIGEIWIGDKQVTIDSPITAIKHKIGYVPEDRLSEGLALGQSIARNMSIANIDSLCKKGNQVDFDKVDENVLHWAQELSLVMQNAQQPAHTLSGGNQQKVVLAKWLEIAPKVLVLNGPTVGVDVGAKHDLHNYLHQLAATNEIAIIIISDDVLEVLENCNRIFVMNHGRFTGEFKNTEVTEQELLAEMTRQE